MTFKTPSFWYRDSASNTPLIERALGPFSKIYQLLYKFDQSMHTSYKASIPVICIGNLVAGGTGKTPTAIAMLQLIESNALAKKPFFLIRGYGGAESGPLLVDLDVHTAWDVGDEALILAKYAPTVVGGNRAAGAQTAMEEGADLIVMDDGLQNTGIDKDLRLVVINGEMGLGNQKLMPAGPLRQTLEDGYDHAHGFILIGEDEHDVAKILPQDKPLLRAHLQPKTELSIDKDATYLAFAGLGYPEKFFNFLRGALQLNVAKTIAFSDHHPYDEDDLNELDTKAKALGAKLITTEKDFMRLPQIKGIHVETLPVEMVWDSTDDLLPLIQDAMHAKA